MNRHRCCDLASKPGQKQPNYIASAPGWEAMIRTKSIDVGFGKEARLDGFALVIIGRSGRKAPRPHDDEADPAGNWASTTFLGGFVIATLRTRVGTSGIPNRPIRCGTEQDVIVGFPLDGLARPTGSCRNRGLPGSGEARLHLRIHPSCWQAPDL